MKRLSVLLLLPAALILGSCSNKNIAWQEVDDMYFTRQDRKRQAEAAYLNREPTGMEKKAETLPDGVFYDSSNNPDELAVTADSGWGGVEYTNDQPASGTTNSVPVVNNIIYNSPYFGGYGFYDPFLVSSFYSPVSLSFNFNWGWGRGWNRGFNPWYPFGWYYNPLWCTGGSVFFDYYPGTIAYGPRINRTAGRYRGLPATLVTGGLADEVDFRKGRHRNLSSIRPDSEVHQPAASGSIAVDNRYRPLPSEKTKKRAPDWWHDAGNQRYAPSRRREASNNHRPNSRQKKPADAEAYPGNPSRNRPERTSSRPRQLLWREHPDTRQRSGGSRLWDNDSRPSRRDSYSPAPVHRPSGGGIRPGRNNSFSPGNRSSRPGNSMPSAGRGRSRN